jgi:hypothetical protein
MTQRKYGYLHQFKFQHKDTKGVLRVLSIEHDRPPFLCASVLKNLPLRS